MAKNLDLDRWYVSLTKYRTVQEVDKKIDKAMEQAELALSRASEAQSEGIKVIFTLDPNKVMDKLYAYRAELHRNKVGEKISERKIELIEMYGKKEFYAPFTHYYFDVKDSERSTDKREVTKEVHYTQKDINKLRTKQVKDADKLTEEQITVLSKWASSTEVVSDINTPELDTPEQEAKFIKRFKVNRDVAFGGSSQLLNKLAYTYKAYPSGRAFVSWLQDIMKDPNIFVQVEKFYRSNWQLQNDIDGAIKQEWYKNFKSFSQTIVEFIDSLTRTLQIDVPDNIRAMYERFASEGYDSDF